MHVRDDTAKGLPLPDLVLAGGDPATTKCDGTLIHNPVAAADDYSTKTSYAPCGDDYALNMLK